MCIIITCDVFPGERIYCLACADQLTFAVAQEVELMFHHLVQLPDRNQDYRLVIITSSQQHYITSVFDEVCFFAYLKAC